jgi:ferredoxin
MRSTSKKSDVEQQRTPGKAFVDLRRCPQNHPCPSLNVCPTGALSQRGLEAPTIDDDACIGCGRCVDYCPAGALQLA